MTIEFSVDSSLQITDRRQGKAFKIIDSDLVGMEVPLGRFANVTCAVSLTSEPPLLRVNRFLFRAGRMTLGNVHSVGWLLRDLCNVHLLNNGFALLHGAALATRSRSIALIGLSNTGKTTTVKKLVSTGQAQTFGDDLFVTDGRTAIACPHTIMNIAPSEFSKHRDRAMQGARRSIPFYEYIGPTTKVTWSKHLGPDSIAEPTEIDTIIFLRRSNVSSIQALDNDAAFEMLRSSNAAEFTFSCNSLFRAHDFLTRTSGTAMAVRNENRILKSLCQRSETILVDGNLDDFNAAAAQYLGLK
ncbi:hypothetical protein HFP89_13480 [Wenzhouxiangella sp. XN79A]|nr:hypothetical protein [Wenzhouxiangella sp. XN79A]